MGVLGVVVLSTWLHAAGARRLAPRKGHRKQVIFAAAFRLQSCVVCISGYFPIRPLCCFDLFPVLSALGTGFSQGQGHIGKRTGSWGTGRGTVGVGVRSGRGDDCCWNPNLACCLLLAPAYMQTSDSVRFQPQRLHCAAAQQLSRSSPSTVPGLGAKQTAARCPDALQLPTPTRQLLSPRPSNSPDAFSEKTR